MKLKTLPLKSFEGPETSGTDRASNIQGIAYNLEGLVQRLNADGFSGVAQCVENSTKCGVNQSWTEVGEVA